MDQPGFTSASLPIGTAPLVLELHPEGDDDITYTLGLHDHPALQPGVILTLNADATIMPAGRYRIIAAHRPQHTN